MSTYFLVYYKKHLSDIDPYKLPEKMSKEYFANNFVYLMPVLADDLDEVYFKSQGEIWSPLGEAREMVLALGVSHTSMSMGDIIFDPKKNVYWFVDSYGFTKVDLTE